MFRFPIENFLPAFLLEDRTGRALAAAIGCGLQIMNDTIRNGVLCVTDVESMPEWRLDEMAWETGILYDDRAEPDTKRTWVREALRSGELYGTKAGILQYLRAIYQTAAVEEWFEYGGDPYHFRVSVSGEWSEEANAWAYEVIGRVKSLRSTLDTISFNATTSRAAMLSGAAVTDISISDTSQEEDAS